MAGLPFRDGGISILSYHSIDDFGTPLSVSPRRFAAHMAALAEEGCDTLTMAEVARHLQAGMPFPRRAMAITFDDGFSSVAEVALPILARYNLKGTVYVITGMVGRRTLWTDGGRPLPSLPILTWAQLEQLHARGIEVGAHTITHGFLTQYSDEQLEDEVQQPKSLVEERLSTNVGAFAYPQGDYDNRVTRAVRKAGYATAVTVDQGRAGLHSRPLVLPRLLVSNHTSLAMLRAFTVPSSRPAYSLINFVVRRVMGKREWPRRKPGDVDSTGSLSNAECGMRNAE